MRENGSRNDPSQIQLMANIWTTWLTPQPLPSANKSRVVGYSERIPGGFVVKDVTELRVRFPPLYFACLLTYGVPRP